MGTSSRGSSASRSRSPRETTGNLTQNIPEMFRTQASNMAPTRGPSQASGLTHSSTPRSSQDTEGIVLMPQQQPSLHDLRSISADIKDTLTAALTTAISDLRVDIQSIAGRVQEIEKTTATHSSVLRRSCQVVDSHTMQLRDLNRHVEDLDNRGRRHNLSLRGLPESIDAEHLQSEVTTLFNNLLSRPPR